MKALTLQQPWATLLATGRKRIETRSWKTSYRGPIAIHAAARIPARIKNEVLEPVGVRIHPVDNPVAWALHCAGYAAWGEDRASIYSPRYLSRDIAQDQPLPLGKVLAIADLVDVVPISACDWNTTGFMVENAWDGEGPETHHWDGVDVRSDIPFGDFRPGRFAWLFKHVAQLAEPIPARGALSLWEWEPDGA